MLYVPVFVFILLFFNNNFLTYLLNCKRVTTNTLDCSVYISDYINFQKIKVIIYTGYSLQLNVLEINFEFIEI